MRQNEENLEELESSSRALYHRHQFCIELPPEVSILDEDGHIKTGLDGNTLSVLAHEYYHYLHNLSTISGYASYELYQTAVAIFSATLDSDARCHPERLTSQQTSTLTTTHRALTLMEGGSKFPPAPSPVINATIQQIERHSEIVGETQVAIVTVIWEIERRDGTRKLERLALGSYFIEEGINYLLEEFVLQREATFTESDPRAVRFYPYRAYRTICTSLSPLISPLAAVRLGILALSSSMPGAALVDALSAYSELRAGGSTDDEACRGVAASMHARVKHITERIRTENSVQLASLLEGRGHLESGMAFVASTFQDLLSRRLTDPWFDLSWCSTGASLDINELMSFMATVVPCDVIQRRPGVEAFARDRMFTYMNNGAASHNGIVALHSQMKFFWAHFGTPGVFFPDVEAKCPFFTSCELSLRRDDPDVCARRPWERSVLPNTCWYGTAVLGTIGLVQIRNVI